ncbi:MAG: SDR family oxidoreductase [Ruminococcus sp.]|nr:SDR family oxidoreductase [Ruminococcus sp.]
MKRTAIITGASSGIGRQMAIDLDLRGFDTVLVARREDKLKELASQLRHNSEVFECDISRKEECIRLYEAYKDREDILVLINNAGFGQVGAFEDIPLDRELDMIDVNIVGVHVLTKLFLRDMQARDKGFILNVASTAGLLPAGPMMATYYATKAYVKSLTLAINEELKQQGSKVWVCALCPGPVDTEFNEVADASFSVSGISAEYCAKYAIRGMLSKELIIIPGAAIKAGVTASRVLPTRLYLKAANSFQTKKVK